MVDFTAWLGKELVSRMQHAKELVSAAEFVRLITHYDGDGISSAGILCNTLFRKKVKFHVSVCKGLTPEDIAALANENNRLHIFSDIGSGELELLKNLRKTIIFDHHVPLKVASEEENENLVHINCRLFGIDGTFNCSASTLVFLFAIFCDERNWDLVDFALTGTITDRQNLGGFKGLNKLVLDEALARKLVYPERSFALEDGTLLESIATSTEPYFRGLAGNIGRTKQFLTEYQLSPECKFSELSNEQKRILLSALTVWLIAQNTRNECIETALAESYISTSRNIDLRVLANRLNACGRMERAGIGMLAAMGNAEALELAAALRREYRQKVLDGLIKIERGAVSTKKNIQYLYSDNPSIAGSHVGLSMDYILDQSKPTFGISVLENCTKISARGTSLLVAKGLDLAAACREAAENVGGRGGGHNIAAGATIPKGTEEKFLEKIDYIVGRQLGNQ